MPGSLRGADNTQGGAGIQAKNVFQAMVEQGLPVRFLVLNQPSGIIVGWDQPLSLKKAVGLARKIWKLVYVVRTLLRSTQSWFRTVKKDRFFNGIPLTFDLVTVLQGTEDLSRHPWFEWADIVHLHWTAGFLADKQPWKEKKWVVSLHDCFPFTGACHFPNDCLGFETGCDRCPQLEGARNPGISRSRFEQKRIGLAEADSKHVILHAPSQWIANLASRSILLGRFPTKVLSHIYPTSIFRMMDQRASRDLFGLPQEKRLALFVAANVTNARKGAHLFSQIIDPLLAEGWEFVVVGGGAMSPRPGLWQLGHIGDLRLLACAYNAADLFLSTSIQDNLPGTIGECQLCGTPVIGFATGGIPEMIEQGETGFLSDEVSLEGLKSGFRWFQEFLPSRLKISTWAQQKWDRQKQIVEWKEFYKRNL